MVEKRKPLASPQAANAAQGASLGAMLADEWRLHVRYLVARNVEMIRCPFCEAETWRSRALRCGGAVPCPRCDAQHFYFGMSRRADGGDR